MKFPSQFGFCLLALLLIVAVGQCSVVCQLTPLDRAKSDTKVPPCHQQSKSSKTTSGCTHPQTALLDTAGTLSFEWAAALPVSGILGLAATRADLAETAASFARADLAPPVCLRI